MSNDIRPTFTARAAFPLQPEQTVAEVKRLAGAERARLNEQIKKLLNQRAAGEALAEAVEAWRRRETWAETLSVKALAQWEALK